MSKIQVTSSINGEPTEFLCEARQSLLEVLRDVVGFTGTKEGCNDGNCGACSVLLDGVLVNSCIVLGIEAENKEITTRLIFDNEGTPEALDEGNLCYSTS